MPVDDSPNDPSNKRDSTNIVDTINNNSNHHDSYIDFMDMVDIHKYERDCEFYDDLYWTQDIDESLKLMATCPYVKIKKRRISFKDVTANLSETDIVTVYADNLGLEYLNVELDDPSGMFSIDKTSIECVPYEPIFNAIYNFFWQLLYGEDFNPETDTNKIHVTYKPTSAGKHNARIIIHTGWGWGSDQIIRLSGNAEERHITVTALSSLRTLTVGESDSIPIHVEGTNLNGTLAVNLDDHYTNTAMFSINKRSINPDATGSINENVMLIYSPTAEGTHGVSVNVSGGGALEVASVVLTGHCENPKPIITVDTTDLDFGTVTLGKEIHKDFTVTCPNLNGYLLLECNDPSYTVSTDRITPNEAANGKVVTITYKPSSIGVHNAFVGISSGTSGGPIVHLTGKCVEPTITVTPSSYDFGTVNAGTTNTAIFTVKGNDLIDPITVVSPYEEGFTVTPEALPASGGKVTVTFKPSSEGSYNQEITLSSCGIFAKINVEGNCIIPPTIKTNVSSLDFGTVVKGKNTSKTFKVTGINLTGDLTLSSNRPHFTVSPSTITAAEAKVGKTVTVTYTPTAGGDHSATLTISGGDAESKPVDLTGKCAAIDVTPSSTHNFGTVKAGTTNTTTFTVKGTNLSERIVLTWPQENGFTITPTDLPASGGKVTVTFKPTAAGSYSQEINLSSSGVSNKITVIGKCATITTSVSSLDFGTVVKDKETSRSFWVKGAYLTGNLTLSSSSSYFKVSPTTITAAEAATGKTVTVTYNPTVKGTHNATITISGGNAATKLVNMTGKSVVPVITTSTSSLNFTGKESKQFKVTGTDLTGNLSLYITGSGSQYFTLSKSSITASAATGGVTVSVLCNAPSSISSATAKVVIYGGDAVPKSIDLNYNQNQPLAVNSVQPGGESGNGDENGNEEFSNGGSLDVMNGLATSVNEMSMKDVKIFAEGKHFIIESPVEQRAIISDIEGRAKTVNLQVGRNEIPINASGIYIVRIREKTTKLIIK